MGGRTWKYWASSGPVFASRYPQVAMSEYSLGYSYGQLNSDDFSDVRFRVVRPKFFLGFKKMGGLELCYDPY